jgi:peptidoglycan/xylan/chitin deacetylase (PgdA/CDA1 family)
MDPSSKVVYLTFDDGPIPECTPQVLDILAQYGVKATFFMVGENVERYPELLARVREEGHAVGNHTYHHLKGFKTCTHTYLQDAQQANVILQTHLFRPPHGRMKYSQKKALHEAGQTIYLWDVLTHDYNPCYSVEKMLSVVKRYTRNGSIIVMHDSLKSKDRMLQLLPLLIQWLHAEGYKCETLP